jgi:hypothetical protein
MLLLWCERKCECEYLFLLLYVVVVSVKSCFCEQMVLLLLKLLFVALVMRGCGATNPTNRILFSPLVFAEGGLQ